MKQIYLAFLLTLILPLGLSAQSKFEMGVQSGFGRFAPRASSLGYGSVPNNSMANDWGWSAGAFMQYNLKARIKPIVELNFYRLPSDVYLEFRSFDAITKEFQIYTEDFSQTSFNQLALSLGTKIKFTKSLYVLPTIEFAHVLNTGVQKNKETFNWHFGVGYSTKFADIVLDYSQGIQEQTTIYDSKPYFETVHRNEFVQLKVQVPLYHF